MTWWQRSAFYALFPPSFQDSNGDGLGDLGGVLRRLDYLSWLGIDAVWLGPIFTTPLIDAGYDISGFTDVDPRFGSLELFDRVLAACHERGMKLVIDLAPNHTSDEHPWFRASRSSRDDPKREWYIWRDAGPNGEPPNNWLDNTGRSAWEWDESSAQFYYHRFLRCQPDLNYRNAEVRQAMNDVLRFWLDRGVDGFRIDAATHLVEDELMRDEPPNDPAAGKSTWVDRPFTDGRMETHAVLREFRRVVDEYDDRLLFGELTVAVDRLVTFYGEASAPELHFPLNNQIMHTEPWQAERIATAMDQYLSLLPQEAWPTWNLGSHDVSRIATRASLGQARVAAMLLLTLPGTLIIYYGDELGLEDVDVPLGELRDQQAPFGSGRDGFRAAMPWSAEIGGGFSSAKPWLPLPEDVDTRNVDALQADESSILHLYRRLLSLRKSQTMLWSAPLQQTRGTEAVLAYWRRGEGKTLFVALNFTDSPTVLEWPHAGRIVLSTHLDRDDTVGDVLKLRADEGIIIEVDPSAADSKQ